jgi:amidase
MLVGETAADVREMEALLGRRAGPGDLEPETQVLALLGGVLSAEAYAGAIRRLKGLGRQLAGFFAQHDVLLTPTLAQPPLPIGALIASRAERVLVEVGARLKPGRLFLRAGALDRIAANAWRFAPFTAPWNATGQPACSVPLAVSPEGLPIGVQLVARLGEEATLLRLASQIEAARPFADRRAPGFD